MIRIALLGSLVATAALAQEETVNAIYGETPRNMALEFKLGPYRPIIDRAATATTDPYLLAFGGGPMLLGELEFDYQFFHAFGSLAAGVSIGYGEKFGRALDPLTKEPTDVSTGLRQLPIRLMAVYRWDWAAINYNIPLVPYLKAGVVGVGFWSLKDGDVEVVDGIRGEGMRFGYMGTAGIALQLDFLDPRLARDFDTGTGVNHTYLFAEFSAQEVNLFGPGFDFSSRHAMFGLAFEF